MRSKHKKQHNPICNTDKEEVEHKVSNPQLPAREAEPVGPILNQTKDGKHMPYKLPKTRGALWPKAT